MCSVLSHLESLSLQASRPFRAIPIPAFLVVLGAVGVGTVAALTPRYAVGGIAVGVVLLFLAWRPLTRASAVLLASLTLLQVSADTSLEKWSYLAILVAASVFASVHLLGRWDRVITLHGRPLLMAAGAVSGVVALSALVAMFHGIALASWVLSIPAYGMLPIAVVLGLDLAVSEHQPRSIAALLLAAGLASALAFAVQWTTLHGVSSLDLGRLLFSSMFLPGAALCLALAYAFDGRATFRMAFFITAMLAAMLVTATRSAVIFALPVVVTFWAARTSRRWRLIAVLSASAVAALLLGSALAVSGVAGQLDFGLIQARLGSTIPLILSGNAAGDPSLFIRSLQTQALISSWLTSPLFGVGPGALYSFGGRITTSPVDSPMVPFARFGLLGVAVFGVVFVALLRSRLRRDAHWVPATALLSFVVLILGWGLVSSPLDDKGTALGLIPLIGLCGVWRLRHVSVDAGGD